MSNEYKEVEELVSQSLKSDRELKPETIKAMDEKVQNTIHTLKNMQNDNVQNKLSFFSKVKLGLFANRKRKFATIALTLLFLVPFVLGAILIYTSSNGPIFRNQEYLKAASVDFAASKITGDGIAQDSEFTLRTELDFSQDELKKKLIISPNIDYEVKKVSEGYKIIPVSNLQRNVLYEVKLESEEIDLDWNFRVEPGFSVLSHSPSETAPLNSVIEFNFNYSDIDLDSVRAAFKSSPIIGIKEIKQEGRTVILVPENVLILNNSYSIYLDNTVKRDNGETLSVPYQSYITTYDSKRLNNYPPSIYFGREEKLLTKDRKAYFSVANFVSNTKGTVKMYKVKNDTYLEAAKEYFSLNSSYATYRLDSKYLEEINTEEFTASADVVVEVPEVANGELIYVEVSYLGIVAGNYYISTEILSHMTYMQNEIVLNVFDPLGKIINEGFADIIYRDDNNQVGSKTFPITGVVKIPKSEIPEQNSILGAVINANGDRLILSMTTSHAPGIYDEYMASYATDSAYNNNVFSYFMMDKPVYTEGDVVRFKTQFRYSEDFTNFQVYDISGLEYIFLYGESIVSRAKPEYNKEASYITGEFNIPGSGESEAFGGTIRIVRGNDVIASNSFPIREYVKPQYTINISADNSNMVYRPGDEVKFAVTVNDLAGNPWSGGEIQAVFGYSEIYKYAGIIGNSPTASQYLAKPVDTKTVKLDSAGHASLVYKIMTPELSETTDFFTSVLQVNIDKHSTKSYGVKSTLGDITVLAETLNNNLRIKPAEEVKILTKTVDTQTLVGVASTIEKLEVVRHWTEKIPKTQYNPVTRTNETIYDYVYHEDIVETQYNLKTDENGNLELVKKYEQDGSYFFRYEFKDRANRPVKYYVSLFYIDEEYEANNIQDNSPTINTDKSIYKVGDKVNIRIEFPDALVDGREALIFVYKDKIYKEEKITVTESVYNYSYDLTKDLSPQAGIRLVYTMPVSSFGSDYAKESYNVVNSTENAISVRRDEDLLNVEILTEKTEYFPGEEVKMKIKVTDENGRTVSGANLNTRVFDRALLSVLNQDTYEKDIYNKVFGAYKRIGGLFTFPRAPYWGGGGDGGGRPDGIRRNFDDVAAFQSNLITDNSGMAELNFTIPDTITTWVVDVDAFTKKLNVGNSVIEVTTNKDIIVNSAFPESVRNGDKITSKVVIYNHTDSPVTGKLVVTAGEGLLLDNNEQNVAIGPRKGGIFNFGAEAKQAKSAASLVTVKLLGEDGRVIDGIEKSIEIRQPGFPTTSFDSKKLISGVNEIKFNITGDVDRTAGNLLISPNSYKHAFYTRDLVVNSSEERAASIIHNLAIYQNYHKGQGIVTIGKDALLDQITLSLAALADLENEDGGYGMFGYSASDLKNSSYAAYALGKGSDSGAGNLSDNNELLTKFLISQIVTKEGKVNDATTPYDKTMAVWALSYINPSKAISYAQMIKSQLNGNETWAELSLLADALYTSESIGDARAVTEEMLSGLQQNDLDQNFIEQEQPYSENRYFANIFLWKMLNEMSIDEAAKEKVGNWIMANPDTQSAFETSLLNEMILNYSVEEKIQDAEIEVSVNGTEIYKGKISEYGDNFTLTGLKSGENIVRITSNREGLRYLLKLSEVTQNQITSTEDFTVKTEYMPLDTMIPSGSLPSGQFVVVRLTVTAKKKYQGYHVKTYLPAGATAGNAIPNLNSSTAYFEWLVSRQYVNKWPQVSSGALTFDSYYDEKSPTKVFEYLLVTDHKGVYGTDGTYVYYDEDSTFKGYEAGKTVTIN